MQIVPFESTSRLPAYLQTATADINNDLTVHMGGGFSVLSIKGKQWAVVRGKEREVLMNPKDPDAVASYVDVVILKANRNTSKTFYLKAYDPNAGEDVKPDCYSTDGISPASDSPAIQSPKCATCRHNQWGSRVSTDGRGGKGKACQDNVRIAVAPNGLVKDPMMLRLPPTSIAPLGEYGAMLAKRGVPYQAVVTRLQFDKESESPKVTFKAVGFLDEQTYHEVKEVSESSVVMSILGSGPASPAQVAPAGMKVEETTGEPSAKAAKVVSDAEVKAAVETAKPKAATKTKPAATTSELEIEIDGLDFDDQP